MNIIVMGAEKWEIPLFKKGLKKQHIQFIAEPLTAKNVSKVKGVDVISVFVHSPMDRSILRQLPKLKMIATRSTGFDHIDLKECKKRRIVVSNVPAYGDNTVAEHTFALMLALSRKVIQSVERTRRGNFSLEGLRGNDLKGKTLGVIGTGKIGRNVAHIGSEGFGMHVIAYDKFPNREWARECGISYVSLNQLLVQSDIITLHVPLMKETYHLMDIKNIGTIKKGALLINTSRGAVVETRALVKALKTGILSGAGLDVLEEECEMKEEAELLTSEFRKKCNVETLLEQHMLLEMDNVIITPHNAFNSEEALHRLVQTTVENIEAFLKGKPANVVE